MRIGELAARTGLSTATIRFYEQVGVITPAARTAADYRDYDDDAVEEISFVRAAQTIGLTLHEVAEIVAFRDRDETPCAELLALMTRRRGEVEQRVAELERVHRDLGALIDLALCRNLDDCPRSSLYELVGPLTAGSTDSV